MKTQIEEFIHFTTVEKGYSPHTAAAYRSDLTQFLDHLTEKGISAWQDVDRACLQEYIQYMHGRGYVPATTTRKIAAIRSFFKFLLAEGVVKETPIRTIESPHTGRRLPHPLSPSEMARLLAEPAKLATPKALRDTALLELMYATGIRASEVIRLEVSAVELESGTVRCMGKGNKERILPLHERACQRLRVYLEEGRPRLLSDPGQQALFLNHLGRPLTRQGIWLLIKEYGAAAGIAHEVTPHAIRHSFATHMLDGGAGLREVQQLMGHASITSTQIYTEVSTRRKREVYDQAHPRA